MNHQIHNWLKAMLLASVAILIGGTISPNLALANPVDPATPTITSGAGNQPEAKKGQGQYDPAKPDPKSKARAQIIMDASTGQVLLAQNINHRYPIASVTKILTLGVIEQDIRAGKLSWHSKVKINRSVAKMSRNWRFSNVTLDQGQSYTVRNLANSMMIVSADASSAALALKDAGSTTAFNQRMRDFAAKAGVHDAKIVNMIGLSNGELKELGDRTQSKNAENLFSALDVAKIARYLVTKYPETLAITSQKTANFKVSPQNSLKMTNINNSLPGEMAAPKNGKVDGLKTGNTDAAGNCYAGTGTFAGHRLIMVVLHASGDYNEQFRHANQDVNTVLASQVPATVAKRADLLASVQRVGVAHGKAKSVGLAPTKSTTVWLPKGTKLSQTAAKVKFSGQHGTFTGRRLRAPVKKGTVVGHVIITPKGQAGTISIPVKTTKAVKQGGWFN